jgi:hypothetical protein
MYAEQATLLKSPVWSTRFMVPIVTKFLRMVS